MKLNKREKRLPALYPSHEREVIGLAGAAAGASTGALAGPPGIAAGAAIGAVIGMAIGRVMDREDERKHQRDMVLDQEIGVTGGELGVAPGDTVSHGDAVPVTPEDEAFLASFRGEDAPATAPSGRSGQA